MSSQAKQYVSVNSVVAVNAKMVGRAYVVGTRIESPSQVSNTDMPSRMQIAEAGRRAMQSFKKQSAHG